MGVTPQNTKQYQQCAQAHAAQLTGKDNWKKFPTQMLSARVVAEGVRAIFPGCLSGFYLAEEAQDFDAPKPEPRKAPTGPGAPKGPLFNAKFIDGSKAILNGAN